MGRKVCQLLFLVSGVWCSKKQNVLPALACFVPLAAPAEYFHPGNTQWHAHPETVLPWRWILSEEEFTDLFLLQSVVPEDAS